MKLFSSFAIKVNLQSFTLFSYAISFTFAQNECIGCAIEDWVLDKLEWGAAGVLGVGGAVANELFNNPQQDQQNPGPNNSPTPQPGDTIEMFSTADKECDSKQPGVNNLPHYFILLSAC